MTDKTKRVDVEKLINSVGTFEFGETYAGKKVIAALSELSALRTENEELREEAGLRKEGNIAIVNTLRKEIKNRDLLLPKYRKGLEEIHTYTLDDWHNESIRRTVKALLSLSPESVNEEYEAMKEVVEEVRYTTSNDHRPNCMCSTCQALARLDKVREGGGED